MVPGRKPHVICRIIYEELSLEQRQSKGELMKADTDVMCVMHREMKHTLLVGQTISGIQDTVKWWDFVDMVINNEVLTAVLLKIEGFVVGLARQQHFFNLYQIFCLHKL
jgi:hypothetical protein